jgi:hypothetical protein
VRERLGNSLLLRVWEQGTFAEVYLGGLYYLERPAAIKVLHVRMQHAAAHDAFLTEAKLIACLQHPRLILVLGLASRKRRRIWSWTMPLTEPCTLAIRKARHSPLNRCCSPSSGSPLLWTTSTPSTSLSARLQKSRFLLGFLATASFLTPFLRRGNTRDQQANKDKTDEKSIN